MNAPMRPEIVAAHDLIDGIELDGYAVLFNTRDNPTIRQHFKATKDAAERWAEWLRWRQASVEALDASPVRELLDSQNERLDRGAGVGVAGLHMPETLTGEPDLRTDHTVIIGPDSFVAHDPQPGSHGAGAEGAQGVES